MDQPSVPTKASSGRVRDAGAKGDALGKAGKQEAGFDEVMSKMQETDAQSSDTAAPAQQGAGRPGERASFWRSEIEAQVAQDDAGKDADPGGLADPASPNALPLPGADAAASVDAAAVNGLAVAMGLNVGGATAKPAAQAGTPEPAQKNADPAGAVLASLEAKSQVADELAAGKAPAPHDALDAGQRAATAPTVASLGARAAANGKDEPADAADATPLPMPATNGATAAAASDNNAATPRTKATILRQETHLPPVSAPAPSNANAGTAAGTQNAPGTGPQPLASDAPQTANATQPAFEGALPVNTPPAQQIADRVAAEATSARVPADRADLVPDQQGSKAALRVLHIALQPADLGTVTVRMELKDAELSLHVQAERAETAELIRNDQDTLSKLLRSAGYAIDSGSIRVADSAAPQPGQNGTQSNPQSSPQSQSGASDRQGHAHRGSGGANGGEPGPQASRNDRHETTDNRAGVGLYI